MTLRPLQGNGAHLGGYSGGHGHNTGKLQALWFRQGQEEGELVKSVRGQEAAQVGWREESQQKERPVWREQERMGGGGTRVPE